MEGRRLRHPRHTNQFGHDHATQSAIAPDEGTCFSLSNVHSNASMVAVGLFTTWPVGIPLRLIWWCCAEQKVASRTGALQMSLPCTLEIRNPRHGLPQRPLVHRTKSPVPTGVPRSSLLVGSTHQAPAIPGGRSLASFLAMVCPTSHKVHGAVF